MVEITIGYSTCPNDTFIFDALINGKIDTGPFRFTPVLADVEELNARALQGDLDITKLSFFAYGHLMDTYQLFNSGSALGRGCGPLVIGMNPLDESSQDSWNVAIPGQHTTAHFLFQLFFPRAVRKQAMLFSEIENAVVQGKADAGVIIHENRFTYAQKGLKKLADLGEMWEQKTGCPIPLGGIAVRRSFSTETKKALDCLIHDSLKYAFEHPESSADYIHSHAQEMDMEVCRQHIELYVNEYSLDLGHEGRKAIDKMFTLAAEMNMIPKVEHPLIVQK